VLVEGTFAIRPNEPAWSLREANLPTPDFHGRHRYQIVSVVRNDKLVEWRGDLGPEENFAARQFQILGGYVDERGRGHVFHSVAELQEMAAEMRGRPQDIYAAREPEPLADWEQAYHDLKDAEKFVASGRSSIWMGARA